jgi:Spy/CpxP family protein refolding chaperone/predicted small secreted protein
MKKIWITLILFSLLLGACNGTTNAVSPAQDTGSSSSTTTSSETVEAGTFPSDEFPEITKNLLGAFLLEDTEFAITAEQAANLYPLWKGLNAMQNSETVSNDELQGLYDQIAEAMTAEQKAQIESLNINQDSLRSVMESVGLNNAGGAGRDGANLTEDQIATLQAERVANGEQGRPAGGPGSGLGGGYGGGSGAMPGGDASMLAAGAAEGTERAVMPEQAGDPTLRMMSRLIEPLLDILQSRMNQ